ncbi:MAG: hypothetical protein ACREBQ_04725 [Nitrososphaerales archaeon]
MGWAVTFTFDVPWRINERSLDEDLLENLQPKFVAVVEETAFETVNEEEGTNPEA